MSFEVQAPFLNIIRSKQERFAESVKLIRDELEIVPFSDEDLGSGGKLTQISLDYQRALLGEAKEGYNNLPMYDTLLSGVDRKNLPKNKKVLVLEIGGSNIKAASLINSDKGLQIETSDGRLLLLKKPVKSKKGINADDFLNEVITDLDSVISKSKPDAIAIIWSFAGKAQIADNGRSVDVVSTEELTKGFTISGISKEPVGKKILSILNERYGIDNNISYAVMNDTRAVEGGIVGTGFNLAFGRFNSESGLFDFFGKYIPKGYRIVDSRSENLGKQLAEKQIAGGYLGDLLQVAVQELEKENLLSQKVRQNKSEFLSGLLKSALDKNISEEFYDPYQIGTLMHLARQTTLRSAQLVGMMIGTGISTFRYDYFPDWEESTEKRFTTDYIVEGGLVENVPGYLNLVNYYANVYASRWGIDVNVKKVENAGIYGAAAAALDIYQKQIID